MGLERCSPPRPQLIRPLCGPRRPRRSARGIVRPRRPRDFPFSNSAFCPAQFERKFLTDNLPQIDRFVSSDLREGSKKPPVCRLGPPDQDSPPHPGPRLTRGQWPGPAPRFYASVKWGGGQAREPAVQGSAPRAPSIRVSSPSPATECQSPRQTRATLPQPERWVRLACSKCARATPLLPFLTEMSTELSHRWRLCGTSYCLLISQDRKCFVLPGHDLQRSTWESGCWNPPPPPTRDILLPNDLT